MSREYDFLWSIIGDTCNIIRKMKILQGLVTALYEIRILQSLQFFGFFFRIFWFFNIKNYYQQSKNVGHCQCFNMFQHFTEILKFQFFLLLKRNRRTRHKWNLICYIFLDYYFLESKQFNNFYMGLMRFWFIVQMFLLPYVGASATDAVLAGYRTILVDDCCRGVDKDAIEETKQGLIKKHGIVINSNQVNNLSQIS